MGFKQPIARRARSCAGASIIEYVLILGLIVLFAAAGLRLFTKELQNEAQCLAYDLGGSTSSTTTRGTNLRNDPVAQFCIQRALARDAMNTGTGQ